jgi:hypothetical protein
VGGRIEALILTAALTAGRAGALAQAPLRPPAEPGASAGLFPSLVADPKEPEFFATYLWQRSPRLASRLGSVGFGQTIALLRTRDWQLSIAAGVFSQFDLTSKTADLMNTDYLVGLPLAYRRGDMALRLRLYHQSSHLGDEYMIHAHAQRVDLSFEAAELLVSRDVAQWRVYGGGEYMFTHSPADLKPGVLHAGLEYHQPGSLVRLGRLAAGRLVAALDGRSVQDRDWQVGWSFVTGLELAGPLLPPGSGWRWSVQLKGYRGPSPYGEFFRDRVSSLGFGLGLTL